MNKTFRSLDLETLSKLILSARERLVFISPGLHADISKSLARAICTVPPEKIHIVLDVDAEVCRLGYGTIEGLEAVQKFAMEHGVTINHHPGIRIGLVVADNTTVIYAPTPLLIEAGSTSPDDKPNAIWLNQAVPLEIANACAIGDGGFATLEIGKDPISPESVNLVKVDLEINPPKKFDIARIELVFNSKLQFVELEIKDYRLQSQSVKLNADLFGIKDRDVAKRLSNKYQIFSNDDDLTIEITCVDGQGNLQKQGLPEKFNPSCIDKERKAISDDFFISAGRMGMLIQRSNRNEFENRIKVLETKIKLYKKAIAETILKRKEGLAESIYSAIKDQLVANPPSKLKKCCLSLPPKEPDVRRYAMDEIENALSNVRIEFDPSIFYTYKDVTYSTFQDKEFQKVITNNFGESAFTDIFNEHNAAVEHS